MNGLRGWIIFAWIALPTVMYGGYSLIRLIKRGNVLTPAQVDFFRAGHAHAGVLTLMSLLYYMFMDLTALPAAVKHAACAAIVVGILAQSGGFFIHLSPSKAALGTRESDCNRSIHSRRCHRDPDLWVDHNLTRKSAVFLSAASVFRYGLKLCVFNFHSSD